MAVIFSQARVDGVIGSHSQGNESLIDKPADFLILPDQLVQPDAAPSAGGEKIDEDELVFFTGPG